MELKKIKYKKGQIRSATFEMSMDEMAVCYAIFGNLRGNTFPEGRWRNAANTLADVDEVLCLAFEGGFDETGCPNPSEVIQVQF